MSDAQEINGYPPAGLAVCEFSAIIPVFNEEEVIGDLLRETLDCMKTLGAPFEIIVVDDGSTDGTWSILKEWAEGNPEVRAFRLSRNFGHQAALFAGMKMSRGRAVGLMDGDGQDPPAVLAKMFLKQREGFDVVYGVRRKRKENFIKRSAYFVFYRVLRSIASIDIPLDSGDFSVMGRKVADFILSMENRNIFLRGLRSWFGGKQAPFEYERESRHGGHPKYTLSKLIKLSLDGVASFSKAPLRASVYIGGATAFGAIGYAVFVIIRKILFDYPNTSLLVGWSSLAVLIAFLCGMTMLMIGFVGEYIAYIFDATRRLPVCIIYEASDEHGE